MGWFCYYYRYFTYSNPFFEHFSHVRRHLLCVSVVRKQTFFIGYKRYIINKQFQNICIYGWTTTNFRRIIQIHSSWNKACFEIKFIKSLSTLQFKSLLTDFMNNLKATFFKYATMWHQMSLLSNDYDLKILRVIKIDGNWPKRRKYYILLYLVYQVNRNLNTYHILTSVIS